MRRFVKTSVPSEGYEEVKKYGEVYVVHLEAVKDGEDSYTCYECTVNEQPDLAQLTADLQEYKAHMATVRLNIAKQEKKKQVEAYDKSGHVNSFELWQDGVKLCDYWIPRDLRTSLEGDVIAASTVGETYRFDIRELDTTLVLNCTKFLEALSSLRRYAYTAYNVTSNHLAAIDALLSVEAVEAYDHTEGYPEKLVFYVDQLQ